MFGENGYTYESFSAAGTSTLSDGTPCVLHSLNITDTTAGTITVKVGTATTAATACVIVGGAANSFVFDTALPGLVIVRNGSTKGNVTYTLI